MWATCYPDHCFCEALRGGALMQPVDALSGLAFVVVAIAIVWRRPNAFAWVSALFTLLIGVGTIYYHARFTMAGQLADNLGMYAFVLWLLWRRLRWRLPWFAASLAASAWVLVVAPDLRRYLFASFAAILVFDIIRQWQACAQRQRRLLAVAIGTFACAFVAWTLDVTRLVCWPDSIVQLHALWHIAGALTVWYLYRAHAMTEERLTA